MILQGGFPLKKNGVFMPWFTEPFIPNTWLPRHTCCWRIFSLRKKKGLQHINTVKVTQHNTAIFEKKNRNTRNKNPFTFLTYRICVALFFSANTNNQRSIFSRGLSHQVSQQRDSNLRTTKSHHWDFLGAMFVSGSVNRCDHI